MMPSFSRIANHLIVRRYEVILKRKEHCDKPKECVATPMACKRIRVLEQNRPDARSMISANGELYYEISLCINAIWIKRSSTTSVHCNERLKS